MRSSLYGFALTLFVTLIAVSPALAANGPAALPGDARSMLGASPPTLPAALQPAQVRFAGPSTLRPVSLVSVPSYTTASSALLAAKTQAVQFQGARGDTSNRHVRWALYGAVAGAVFGLLDGGSELRDTLIGAGVGLLASFVVHY